MPLSNIRDRPHGDTRSLNDDHINELTESIAAVGLIQPIAVDKAGHLLAGGHRRAALQVLEHEQPKRYQELFPSGVPVRVFEFDASENADQAIAIEAAENEKRRDYTPAEVRELADRLVEAGYSRKRGGSSKGRKPLTPALMTIVGKSRATIKRYLAAKDEESQGNGSYEPLLPKNKAIIRLASALDHAAKFDLDPAIAKQAEKLRRMLQKTEG